MVVVPAKRLVRKQACAGISASVRELVLLLLWVAAVERWSVASYDKYSSSSSVSALWLYGSRSWVGRNNGDAVAALVVVSWLDLVNGRTNPILLVLVINDDGGCGDEVGKDIVGLVVATVVLWWCTACCCCCCCCALYCKVCSKFDCNRAR